MKYIRTKDKIIDLTSKPFSSYEIVDNKTAIEEYGEEKGFIMVYYFDSNKGEHIEYDGKGGCSMDNWYLEDIKQADTIEELCDMFVVWQEDCNMPVEMPLTEKEQYERMKKVVSVGMKAKMNIWLKVAIWTDDGLKYVAKMNEDGELCLI